MLFNTPILDVAIGFLFVFTLLALLVTQINNVIGTALKWRSKQLKQGLQKLITDPELQAELLTHPLIRMVELDDLQIQALNEGADLQRVMDSAKPTGVTWIQSNLFVEALVSILYRRASGDLFGRISIEVDALPVGEQKSACRAVLRRFQEYPSYENLNELRGIILTLPDNFTLVQLYDELEAKLPQISFQSSDLIGLVEGVEQIADPALRRVLEAIVKTANNLDEARQKIENWFNDGMDRTSQAFQRHMQRVTLVVSILLVSLLNVDSLQLGRALWQDRELRDTVGAVAQGYAETAQIARQQEIAAGADPSGAELLDEMRDNLKQVGETYQKLIDLQLPIGWEFTSYSDPASVAAFTDIGLPDPRSSGRNLWNMTPANPEWLGVLLKKIIGLAVSAVAASQGAPFWFDLLRRLTRGSSQSDAA
jgi:hypothetical protein